MKEECNCKPKYHHAAGGGVYCLGLIGALVYFISHAATFGEGVWGVLKSLVWPALLVHKFLTMVNM